MYPLTARRLGILVKSHHLAIKRVEVDDRDFNGQFARVIIKLRWWYFMSKKKFIKCVLPEIKKTIDDVKPVGIVIKYELV